MEAENVEKDVSGQDAFVLVGTEDISSFPSGLFRSS